MDIREQVMADDVRREFRAGDLDVLMAILRAEDAGDDAGGGLVAGGGKPLDMQTRIGGGYPFGREYPWGIAITGDTVTVYEQIIYRGGVAHVIATQDVQITANNDYLAMKCVPGDTPAADVFSIERWPDADGVPEDTSGAIYRAIHQFSLASGAASWLRACWLPCDLGTMGY